MKKVLIPITLMLVFLFCPFVRGVNAEINQASDLITTSRPSAGTVLTADQAASSSVVSLEDNGFIMLASDSAIFRPDAGETLSTSFVSSMSSKLTGTPNYRDVFFTTAPSSSHHLGDAVVVPATAGHKIQFTTPSGIAANGHLVITFPGAGQNIGSPSATTFDFNGMASTNPSDIAWNNVTCASVAVSAPTIDCTVNGSGVGAGTIITVTIGPRLINPINADDCSGATTCISGPSSDVWKIYLTIKDAANVVQDTGLAKIAVIEPVLVQAYVEPTLTFTIQGLANATNYNSESGSGNCGSETSNSGIDTTATGVSLGYLSNGLKSKAAQELTISSNTNYGYVITATSSGKLRSSASGYAIPDANGGNGLTSNDTPAPAIMTAGTAAFGISPCGSQTDTGRWGNGTVGDAGASVAKFSNPWNTGANSYYATISSYNGGNVSSQKTIVRYAATIDITPPGTYFTTYTYVATVTF